MEIMALVTLIAKVEGVVKEKFSGAPPQTPTYFAPPPIKIPGGDTVPIGIRIFSDIVWSIILQNRSILS